MEITELYKLIEACAFELEKHEALKDKIGAVKGYVYLNEHGIKFIIDWYHNPGKVDQKLKQFAHMVSWIEYGFYKNNLKSIFIREIEHIKYQIHKHYRKPENA